jgi:hypothetical protein
VTDSHNLDSLERLVDVARAWPNTHVYLAPLEAQSFSDDAAALDYQKERQWKWPLVPGENGYIGPIASWVGAGQINYFDPRRADPNETFTYPVRDLTRNAQTSMAYHEHWWFGKLGNGSQIEPCNYT